MARRHWLMKSEPFKYPWSQLLKDGRTYWDGVRNYEARNNLAAMKAGDLALFYHSNEGKEVVGIAEIVKSAYPDPTSEDPAWVVVDIAPRTPLATPVSLATIKSDPDLKEIQLIRRSRLSVVPLTEAEFARILALGRTRVSKSGAVRTSGTRGAAKSAKSEKSATAAGKSKRAAD